MRYNFCTLFDRNFLYKGLALHRSLLRVRPNFALWILCLDDETYRTLSALQLDRVTLISLAEFEDPALKAVKPARNAAEYCWTCSPSLPLYLLKTNPILEQITYLDADLYFYAGPEPVYRAFADRSILIIPHRFSPELARLEKTSGTYNVGMLVFRNDRNGLACLEWWRQQCLDWCFDFYDNGRLGDQLYLDDWPNRFAGVHVLENLGAGLAPWNVSQYALTKKNNAVQVNGTPLVFYHFHALDSYTNLTFQPHKLLYNITRRTRRLIYRPYLKELKAIIIEIKKKQPQFSAGLKPKPSLLDRARYRLNRDVHLPLKRAVPGYNRLYQQLKKMLRRNS